MRTSTKRGLGVLIAIVLALNVACASTPPDRIAYNTIDGVVNGVHQAMLAFNDRYQAGLQTEADRTKVLATYATYQKSIDLAITLAKDVTQGVAALQIANDAAQPLLALIVQLTPKK